MLDRFVWSLTYKTLETPQRVAAECFQHAVGRWEEQAKRYFVLWRVGSAFSQLRQILSAPQLPFGKICLDTEDLCHSQRQDLPLETAIKRLGVGKNTVSVYWVVMNLTKCVRKCSVLRVLVQQFLLIGAKGTENLFHASNTAVPTSLHKACWQVLTWHPGLHETASLTVADFFSKPPKANLQR